MAGDGISKGARAALSNAAGVLLPVCVGSLAEGVAISERLRVLADTLEHVTWDQARDRSTWEESARELGVSVSNARGRYSRLRMRVLER